MIFEEMLKEERAEGFAEGRAKGLTEGCKEILFLFLQNFGDVPAELFEQIQMQQDIEVLKSWVKIAVQSKTLEEFIQKM